MTPGALQKLAYTVECFFNATRTPDTLERTAREEGLVQWLLADKSGKAYAVYHRGSVFCHDSAGKATHSFPLREGSDGRALWCDGRKISRIDAEVFRRDGRLMMLGVAGLILSMPGTGNADALARKKAELEMGSDYSNNNNNNNNNNNG